MRELPEVTKALKQIAPTLPRASAIDDLAYLVNAGASGEPYLLVYVILKNARRVPFRQKLEVEDQLRAVLGAATPGDIHVRWRTADEQKEVLGLRDVIRTVSVLH